MEVLWPFWTTCDQPCPQWIFYSWKIGISFVKTCLQLFIEYHWGVAGFVFSTTSHYCLNTEIFIHSLPFSRLKKSVPSVCLYVTFSNPPAALVTVSWTWSGILASFWKAQNLCSHCYVKWTTEEIVLNHTLHEIVYHFYSIAVDCSQQGELGSVCRSRIFFLKSHEKSWQVVTSHEKWSWFVCNRSKYWSRDKPRAAL